MHHGRYVQAEWANFCGAVEVDQNSLAALGSRELESSLISRPTEIECLLHHT